MESHIVHTPWKQKEHQPVAGWLAGRRPECWEDWEEGTKVQSIQKTAMFNLPRGQVQSIIHHRCSLRIVASEGSLDGLDDSSEPLHIYYYDE